MQEKQHRPHRGVVVDYLLSLMNWRSNTLSQGYTTLQSLIKCLDHTVSALPALVAPYAAYCGVGMPSAPAPSMLKMWPPEVCMTCMAALVHSSVPTMLVLTTCCNCSGEESMKACNQ